MSNAKALTPATIGNPISSIILNVSTDALGTARFILFLLFSAATAGVIFGVWLENESFKDSTKDAGWKILIVSLAFELIFSTVVFSIDSETTRRLQSDLSAAGTVAAGANTKASAAMARAADLLKENVELEGELAPRDFNQLALAQALAALPKVPIILMPLEREEPAQISSYVFTALTGISVAGSTPWTVTTIFEHEWNPEGITFEYVADLDMGQPLDKNPETVAAAMCHSLENSGILVGVHPKITVFANRDWPTDRPRNAVVVRIGQKPNHFWENKRRREQGSPEIPVYSYCTPDELSKLTARASLEQRHKRQEETERTP